MIRKNMALCEGRHSVPGATDGAIFPGVVDPLDLSGQAAVVAAALEGVQELNLYVTGLTVALVTVINHCRQQGVRLTLWHFNRDTGDYFPQAVA
jgi:hypothetical protein